MTASFKFAPKSANYAEKNKGTARAFPNRATFFGLPAVRLKPRSGGGLFSKKIKSIIIKIKQMEIKNIKKEIIFRTDKDNIKDAIEDAVKRGEDLRYADLRAADLRGANLRAANLSYADLIGANLIGANLRAANFRGTNLRDANLGGADLSYADFRAANLGAANLSYADLRGANLIGANLRGANFRGAENIPFVPIACPSDGEFTGWKSAINY